MSTVKKRSPLDRAPPLRAPGQSLTEQLQDDFYDHFFAPGMIAVMMVLMAGLEWFRYFTAAKPNPVIYTVVAGMAVAYATVKMWRAKKIWRKSGLDAMVSVLWLSILNGCGERISWCYMTCPTATRMWIM